MLDRCKTCENKYAWPDKGPGLFCFGVPLVLGKSAKIMPIDNIAECPLEALEKGASK